MAGFKNYPVTLVPGELVNFATYYGATGGGVVDDTAALQTTINQAALQSGIADLTDGTYLISSTLNVPANVTVRGHGAGTIIRPTAAMNGAFTITGNDAVVTNLVIEPASSTYTLNPAANGIYMSGNIQRFLCQNVSAYYLNGWFVQSVVAANLASDNCELLNCYHRQGKAGISFAGGSTNTWSIALKITDCFMDTMYNGENLLLTDCHDVVVKGFYGVNNALPGIHIVGISSAIFIDGGDSGNMTAAATPSPAIQYDSDGNGSPQYIFFTGGIYGTSTDGVLVNSGNYMVHTGCTFYGSSANDIAIAVAAVVDFIGCVFASTSSSMYCATGNSVLISGGFIAGYTATKFSSFPPARGCVKVNGVNPAGHQASPGVPGSTTALVNPFVFDCEVVVITGAGVTVSAIALGGTATGLTMAASASLPVRVQAGQSITLTYAGGTPSWNWFGD